MEIAQSYPICPPSTMAGCIESMCGEQRGSFQASGSKLAYGWVRRPLGHGFLIRREQTIANSLEPILKAMNSKEGWRPVKRECWFDMIFRVVVTGAFEDQVRKALVGDVARTGVLSLGDSDDAINWISETEAETEWLVPGDNFALPLRVPTTCRNIQAVYQTFGMTKPVVEIPETAWMTPGGTP